jgi:hypothetical protein
MPACNGHADLSAHHVWTVWARHEVWNPQRGKWVTRKVDKGQEQKTVERRVPCVLTRGMDVAAHEALQDVEAGFNARYVLELIEGERGQVKLHGMPGNGGPWRIALESYPEAIVVIMPCRV